MAAWSLPELAGRGRTGGAAVDPAPRGRSSSAPRPRARAVESPSLPQRAAHRAPRRRERLADVRGAPHAACRLRRGLRRSRRGARQVGRARVRLSRAGPRAPCEDGFSRSDPDPPRPGAAQGSNAHQRDSLRSFSRYVCVRGPSVAVHWHKVPARRTGQRTSLRARQYAALALDSASIAIGRRATSHPAGHGPGVRLSHRVLPCFLERMPRHGLEVRVVARVPEDT